MNEADVGRVRPGQKVRFTVDAHPGRVSAGEVGQIRLNATTTQNVVTYTVVTTHNPDGALLPYLIANLVYHYFEFRRDEFLAHYHKRSNAESVFSSVKRKFGDALRSKSRSAQVNELLLKFLRHNLCVLNDEVNELGIARCSGRPTPAQITTRRHK